MNTFIFNKSKIKIVVPLGMDKHRLDHVISKLLTQYSRSIIQKWIKIGYVVVGNKNLRAKDKVYYNQIIEITILPTVKINFLPQSIVINVIYEDQDIIVVNKQAGLVVHPGNGQPDNTLLNALIYHYPELINIPRAGIIHRLDKDTSGLLIVARNLTSHVKLIHDLQMRNIKREYITIVNGILITGGTINLPIGRHPIKRTCMAVIKNGKNAITHYRIIKCCENHTCLKVILETGRTHQIRVHLSYIGYPILGDNVYGGCKTILYKTNIKSCINRQALHAQYLTFRHPRTNQLMKLEATLPDDIKKLIQNLE